MDRRENPRYASYPEAVNSAEVNDANLRAAN
jgi:hypothetical protein